MKAGKADAMPSLNISKVAVGCASFDALRKRQESRVSEGTVPIVTRFRPKRADELVGGSIHWIVKHRITARNTILGFGEAEDGRTLIRLDPKLVPVRAWPKRAHQGWRYLSAQDAPTDFDACDEGLAALPPALAIQLAALALI
ncbi:MAG TPA: DUF1489 family protein [Allosphingosinicella sp.]|nr:DUF1489 family protein [Allosphingosinicella sp.]